MSGEKPSSGSLHYTNSVLDGGYLVIGDYKVTFNQDGKIDKTEKNTGSSSSNQSGGNNQQQTGIPLVIGTNVNYVTSLNSVELSDWKVFLSDENYTYLIYGDYIPNSAIDSSLFSGISGLDTEGVTYGFYYESASRTNVVNDMLNQQKWNSLLVGTLNGNSIDLRSNSNADAIGSPTLDLWVQSYNTSYPSQLLYTRYISSDEVDNENFLDEGYYISSETPVDTSDWNTTISMDDNSDNELYYPQDTAVNNYFYGYFLAAFGGGGYGSGDRILTVKYYGGFDDTSAGDSDIYSFRPIIKLPTSVLNQ